MPVNQNRVRAAIIDRGTAEAVADLQRNVRSLQSAAGSTLGAGSISGQVVGQIDGTTNVIAGTITANSIAAGAITALAIDVGALTAYIINGNSIDLTDNVSNTHKLHLDPAGIKGFDNAGNEVFFLDTFGNLGMYASSVGGSQITLGQLPPASAGARIVLDDTGIKGYNAGSNVEFDLDATTGILTCTAVITAQQGSALPVDVIVGDLPGSANRYSDSAFQDGQGNFSTTTANGAWAGSACTLSNGGTTVPTVYGTRTCKVTASGANANVFDNATPGSDAYKRVLPGLNYSFSHYVWPSTANRNGRIDIKWYNSAGVQVGTTHTGITQLATVGEWNRITETGQAPVGAAFGKGFHYVSTTDGLSGDVFYIECLQMEQGDRASAWGPRPDEILYYSINANMLQAGSVTAGTINVANLSVISQNAGSITSGTITSATVQSSSTVTSTGGVLINATGLYGYNSSGGNIFSLSSSGLTMTGTITATGGTISGTLTVSGALQTGATGARVVLDSAGLRAYDASGNTTFNMRDSDGSVLIAGAGIGGGITMDNTGIHASNLHIDTYGRFSGDVFLYAASGSSPTLTLYANDGAETGTINMTTGQNMVYNTGPGNVGFHVFQVAGSQTLSIGSNLNLSDGTNLTFGSSSGTKFGTTTSQKIGFYGIGPVAQPGTTGNLGFTNGTSGTAVQMGFNSNGNFGSTSYNFNDVVRHLKVLGLIAS